MILMDEIENFPIRCRKNIRRLMNRLSTDAGTSYRMMLMTAALMDLNPEDRKVADMILTDCRVEVET